jgi:hypothetical protein
VLTALPEKPPKPTREWSIREAIALLQDVILAALDKGYSHEDVAALLNQAGIPVSPSSLRYYLSRLKPSVASQPAPVRSKPPRTQKPKQRARAIAPTTPAIATSNPTFPTFPTEPVANHPATNRSVENVIAYLLDEPETPAPQAISSAVDQASSTSKQKRKKRKR